MSERAHTLAPQPPRKYGFRDAYNGRVWRSTGVILGRELFFFGLVFAGLGFANDQVNLVYLGWTALIIGVLWAGVSSILSNARRVRLVREGPAVNGVLDATVRVPLCHEIFRRERERTFVLKYTYVLPEGQTRSGRIWICGCARDHLQFNSREQVAFNPGASQESLPLRLAMMVAPHR